jgi:lipoate-protein ligase A
MQLNVLVLDNEPIVSQLTIEEALLRADSENWCIVNSGSSPAIVLGISGKPEEFVDIESYAQNKVPLIRRFSGGGTVVVDENTFFVSFIMSKSSLDFGVQPREILRWTEALYKPVFSPKAFGFTENDYTIGDRKVGGNAHYFTKDRWLHHTTFLWDYDERLMALLSMPAKVPDYRKKRSHIDFVDRLKNYYPSLDFIKERLLQHLAGTFSVKLCSKQDAAPYLDRPHRKSVVHVHLPPS